MWQRPTEPVSLDHLAPHVLQGIRCVLIFYAFGNDAQSEVIAEFDYFAHDLFARLIGQDFFDQTSVHFDARDIKRRKMGQARKANPEVIEVHLKSGSAQIADNRRVGFRFIDVAKVRRFQNLNRDIATVDAGRLNPPNEAIDKFGMCQQFGGGVKCNVNVRKARKGQTPFFL